jgi:hypothetical protein
MAIGHDFRGLNVLDGMGVDLISGLDVDQFGSREVKTDRRRRGFADIGKQQIRAAAIVMMVF